MITDQRPSPSNEPRQFLEWLRQHPEDPMYNQIEWDVEKAAHQRRLQQARELIAKVEPLL